MRPEYHFIGAGGIGMSGLAQIVLNHGAIVSGSDKKDSPILRRLRALGASMHVGHNGENVPPGVTVVASDAIREENPEMLAARAMGLPVLRRSDLLAQLMEQHEGIAVSGTHGKTSTTSMVARVLTANGCDPSVVVGGESLDLSGNARAGNGSLFLAEACEAFDSFLQLKPRIAVVTNIEPDHLDHHGGFEHLKASFRAFAGNIEPDGLLIVNADDPEAAALGKEHTGRVMTYGITAGWLQAAGIQLKQLESRFVVTDRNASFTQKVSLGVPGVLNVSNALAAFAVGLECGISTPDIARALATYSGVRRRFEEMGNFREARVFDDYAHHPTEIRATLAAAHTAFPTDELVAVFQPHLFTRTRDFLTDFIAAFDDADVVIITDIYAAREEPLEGVSAAAIVNGIRRRSPEKDVYYIPDRRDVPDFLTQRLGRGDVLLTMGAGDIRVVAEELLSLSREGVPA